MGSLTSAFEGNLGLFYLGFTNGLIEMNTRTFKASRIIMTKNEVNCILRFSEDKLLVA